MSTFHDPTVEVSNLNVSGVLKSSGSTVRDHGSDVVFIDRTIETDLPKILDREETKRSEHEVHTPAKDEPEIAKAIKRNLYGTASGEPAGPRPKWKGNGTTQTDSTAKRFELVPAVVRPSYQGGLYKRHETGEPPAEVIPDENAKLINSINRYEDSALLKSLSGKSYEKEFGIPKILLPKVGESQSAVKYGSSGEDGFWSNYGTDGMQVLMQFDLGFLSFVRARFGKRDLCNLLDLNRTNSIIIPRDAYVDKALVNLFSWKHFDTKKVAVSQLSKKFLNKLVEEITEDTMLTDNFRHNVQSDFNSTQRKEQGKFDSLSLMIYGPYSKEEPGELEYYNEYEPGTFEPTNSWQATHDNFGYYCGGKLTSQFSNAEVHLDKEYPNHTSCEKKVFWSGIPTMRTLENLFGQWSDGKDVVGKILTRVSENLIKIETELNRCDAAGKKINLSKDYTRSQSDLDGAGEQYDQENLRFDFSSCVKLISEYGAYLQRCIGLQEGQIPISSDGDERFTVREKEIFQTLYGNFLQQMIVCQLSQCRLVDQRILGGIYKAFESNPFKFGLGLFDGTRATLTGIPTREMDPINLTFKSEISILTKDSKVITTECAIMSPDMGTTMLDLFNETYEHWNGSCSHTIECTQEQFKAPMGETVKPLASNKRESRELGVEIPLPPPEDEKKTRRKRGK
jgi:hypothetical protein